MFEMFLSVINMCVEVCLMGESKIRMMIVALNERRINSFVMNRE